MRKYYKAIKKDLTSCFIGGKANVQYKINEYVNAPDWLPKENKFLFVFSDFHNAYVFASTVTMMFHKKANIYECEVQGVSKKLPSFLDTNFLARGEVNVCRFLNFPKGTVAVRKVKLIKEAWNNKRSL